MLRKSIKCTRIIVALVMAVMLCACSATENGEQTVEDPCMRSTYIQQFGPNDDGKYWYCYTDRLDGYARGKLLLYDMNTDTTETIFEVEKPERERITGFTCTDDVVSIHVTCGKNDFRRFQYVVSQKELLEIAYEKPHTFDDFENISFSYGQNQTVWFRKEQDTSDYSYSTDGIEYENIEKLSELGYTYGYVYEDYLTSDGKDIYGVVSSVERTALGRSHHLGLAENVRNEYVIEDTLFVLSPQTGECKILYQLDGADGRIVGYRDGYVYLMRENACSCVNLENLEEEQLTVIDAEKDDDIAFCWLGQHLIIFNESKSAIVGQLDVE